LLPDRNYFIVIEKWEAEMVTNRKMNGGVIFRWEVKHWKCYWKRLRDLVKSKV
jgi:hypothetical protein